MNRRAGGLLVVALVMGCTQAKASPCSDIRLPEQVQQKLSTAYVGWKIVTAALLPYYDRPTWLECCAKECPGLIQGKFTGEQEGHVLNLILKTQNKTLQQIVYFQPTKNGFDVITICPSAVRGPILVIRKGPPDRYRDRYTGRSTQGREGCNISLGDRCRGSALLLGWNPLSHDHDLNLNRTA